VAFEDKTPTTLPGYFWLALLAGIMGFSAVRSVVVDKATGIRPNGVLAQIHRLNAERRGEGAAAAAIPPSAAAAALGAIGGAIGNVASKTGNVFGKLAKLNPRKRG
jgi:hypothetical protein